MVVYNYVILKCLYFQIQTSVTLPMEIVIISALTRMEATPVPVEMDMHYRVMDKHVKV